MIDIELLRRDPASLQDAVTAKGVTDVDIMALFHLDEAWRKKTAEVERLRHEQRRESADIAAAPKTFREQRQAELKKLHGTVKGAEDELAALAAQRLHLLLRVPNPPLPDVPKGRGPADNVVDVVVQGAEPSHPKPYMDVAAAYGIIDTVRAARSSGSRFGALVGDGALLELALVRFAFAHLTQDGFIPVIPPVMLKREGLAAMGYLERGEEEVYRTQDDLYLVGTSEQSLGAMHAGETFREDELPRRYAAFSTCFRREAGSYGKDTRGIIRVHQFDKVEMFSFCHPARSVAEQRFFLQKERELMDALELPYRVLRMCTGDLGDSAAAKFDIETWFPATQEYRETHSVSNTTDFQTRRLGVTCRAADGATRPVHSVNGTAFAVGRTIAALLECHQQDDGSVRVPRELRPYLDGRETLHAVPQTSPRSHGRSTSGAIL